MRVEVVENYDVLSLRAAEHVAGLIKSKPKAVIGFATGSTPLGLYRQLIRMHRDEGLDFSGLTTFNLDEYIGLAPEHEQSYNYFMWDELFGSINVNPELVNIPLGTVDDIEQYCQEYEEKIAAVGGLDLQILGIGTNGHLAFNEPGSSLRSRTRRTILTADTVASNARFFESADEVPRHAITMGIGSILDARQLLMLAGGAGKATAVKASLEGPLTAMMPGSAMQLHPDVHVYLDFAAASGLEYHHHDGIAEPKG